VDKKSYKPVYGPFELGTLLAYDDPKKSKK
jgi:hypothetical protein